jgi:hypothetical protein
MEKVRWLDKIKPATNTDFAAGGLTRLRYAAVGQACKRGPDSHRVVLP